MALEIVAATIEKIFAADLVLGPLTVIWHAGEPLAVPISYYRARLTRFGEKRRQEPSSGTVCSRTGL